MSRTKVKQNLIDASFGNILEQIVYYADGGTVATSAGVFTAPNITAMTNVTSSTFVENTGCAIAYTPPSGATRVHYESKVMCSYYNPDTHMSPTWYVTLDNTIINQTKRTELQQYTYEMNTNTEAIVRIDSGFSDDIANSKLASWGSAKTFKVFYAGYGTSNYRFRMNGLYHYAGAGAQGIVIPPVIKITAYS
jgi:hypothetical protein